ncbi:MAG TPA: ribonuclease HI family protein [Fimbriiglobus sp.]|jgi:ribonuclease HI|nr:ribonuclease HI family protein [Fimbriiglobus sp.]
MSEPTATVHIDGAARGNPGPAAYALVLRRPGLPVVEEAEPIGKATNNVAEYTALVHALERASELGVKTLAVFSDSELLVKQMNGEYRVKHPDLQDLYAEAQQLRKRFDRVTLTHVRRAQNADADRLCNEALDGKRRRETVSREAQPSEIPPSEAPPRVRGGAPEPLEEEAVALLNAVAKSWSGNGAASPTAVEVWDRLWAILGEHGVLKKQK